MKRLISIVCMILVQMSLPTLHIIAQDDNCPSKMHTDWQTAATQIYVSYDEAIKADPKDISDVATLQNLRRQLDSLERPLCDEEAYAALQGALNLTGDSIVNGILGRSDESATLLSQAKEQQNKAAELLAIQPPTTATLADMTEPKDGATVPFYVKVTGNYDSTKLEDNNIWVFVVPPNNVYYPQAFNACPEPNSNTQPSSVNYQIFSNTWDVDTFFGKEDENHGDKFVVALMLADAATTQKIFDKFTTDWCPAQNFSGLSPQEVKNMGLKTLQFVTVTRQ